MLKPNLNGKEGCTSPALVEALIQLLSDSGVGQVVIAESTFGDARMTDAFFAQTGFVDLARRYGLRLINLNASEVVEVPVANPMAVEKLSLAREVLEADRIINLPVMKVHYATGVTLAMKNLKGLLVGPAKRRFHEVGLDRGIVDLNNTVRTHLHIVDATECMERMGPRGGDTVTMNLLLAGGDAAEVDWTGCRIMGYDLDEVRHLKLYVEARGQDLSAVEVRGERIEDVRRPFKKVDLARTVPASITIRDGGACSACMNALLLSCQLLVSPPTERVSVRLGGHAPAPDTTGGLDVVFGNCCVNACPSGAADSAIRGCPPYPFALGELLRGRAGKP
jgi:uncharacterized protein (DUF362 family)